MQIFELLDYAFFRNALWGSLLASIACGIIGTYIVVRRLVFISGGITHASLGGLGIGFYFGFNPILSAMIFSVLSAFGIEWLSSKQGVREDSAIASFWSLGMAIGIIFIFLKPGYAPNLTDYLFGNILTIANSDILYLGILSFILVALFTLFHRQILYIAFDADFAKTRGIAVRTFEYLMMLCIAVSIVLSIRLVGVVLLMSLLTIPQMTANLFTSNFRKMIFLSITVSFVCCVCGLILSYYLNIPSGAFIILLMTVLFGFCKWISSKKIRSSFAKVN
jgi:zinc transport system permease protein